MVVKTIYTGADSYREYICEEQLNPEHTHILPKTAKGKPKILTAANISSKTSKGIYLAFRKGFICIGNITTQKTYYANGHEETKINDIEKFRQWVEAWCKETTEEDIEDIKRFAEASRIRVRYKEGDVFRIKVGRRRYTYGRLLLNYDLMRKNEVPFWNIFMGKPLVCSVYHILTDRRDVTVEELRGMRSLPSQFIMDNCLFYGEYEIIGNIPVSENEDYPIMYGKDIRGTCIDLCYQCGKTYLMKKEKELYPGFRNNGVCGVLCFEQEILEKCIEAGSNEPYWNSGGYYAETDLRNPKHADKLRKIKKQFGLK